MLQAGLLPQSLGNARRVKIHGGPPAASSTRLTAALRKPKVPRVAGAGVDGKAELLGVPYFHVVFTLPVQIGAIAYADEHPLTSQAGSAVRVLSAMTY